MSTTTTDHPLQHMVAPGQEAIFEEFLQEQAGDAPQGEGSDTDPLGQFLKASESEQPPAAAEGDGLPEKYRGKSAAEVYRLMQVEQEYRAKQQGQQEAPAAPVEIPEFSRDKSVADYGENLTAAFEAAEVNPYEIDARVRAGEEIDTGTIDKLAEATGFSKAVVEGYINSFRPAPEAAPQGQALDDAAVAEIVQQAGGAERIAKVNEWVTANVEQAEIDAFNSMLDTGNKAAALAMLRGFDARYSAAAPREPELLAGGTPNLTGGGMVFDDIEELTAAMAKTDERGRRLYNTDPKYRKQVDAAAARSRF